MNTPIILVMAALKVAGFRLQTSSKSYEGLDTATGPHDIPEEAFDRANEMATRLKHFHGLLEAGTATGDEALELQRDLASARRMFDMSMMPPFPFPPVSVAVTGTPTDDPQPLFQPWVQFVVLLLALSLTGLKCRRLLVALFLLAAAANLMDLYARPEATWSIYWKRGENLLPAQPSLLQELIMTLVYQITNVFSLAPADSLLLPLPGMSFNSWLLAETMLCALNVAFLVCCYRAAASVADCEIETEPKPRSQVERKKKPTPLADAVVKEIVFLNACLNGNTGLTRTILKSPDFDVNCIDAVTGDTGLHLACGTKNLSIVQMILSKKESLRCVNAGNADNQTPLIIAAAVSAADVVKALLRNKGIELGGDLGSVPVALAVKNDDWKVAEAIYLAMKEKDVKLGEHSVAVCVERFLTISKELATSKSLSEAKRADRKITLRYCKGKILSAILGTGHATDTNTADVKTEQDLVQTTHAGLRDVCECPVCMRPFADRPIFACDNDHWLCGDCSGAMVGNCCPTCRLDFGLKPPKRCFTYEKIARLVEQLPTDGSDD